MSARTIAFAVSVLCSTAVALAQSGPSSQPRGDAARQSLKAPSDFASIGDPAARSRAMFGEIGKLLTHPRCLNCHPAGDRPLQGADHHEHFPPVYREDRAAGRIGTLCTGCHTEANYTLHEAATYESIPGHPRWTLAPLSMAWEGKSVGDICRQLKDTE